MSVGSVVPQPVNQASTNYSSKILGVRVAGGRADSREFQKAILELAVPAAGYIAFTLYIAL